jgi:hypothetical protein
MCQAGTLQVMRHGFRTVRVFHVPYPTGSKYPQGWFPHPTEFRIRQGFCISQGFWIRQGYYILQVSVYVSGFRISILGFHICPNFCIHQGFCMSQGFRIRKGFLCKMTIVFSACHPVVCMLLYAFELEHSSKINNFSFIFLMQQGGSIILARSLIIKNTSQ